MLLLITNYSKYAYNNNPKSIKSQPPTSQLLNPPLETTVVTICHFAHSVVLHEGRPFCRQTGYGRLSPQLCHSIQHKQTLQCLYFICQVVLPLRYHILQLSVMFLDDSCHKDPIIFIEATCDRLCIAQLWKLPVYRSNNLNIVAFDELQIFLLVLLRLHR
jgi:hypothetical protein